MSNVAIRVENLGKLYRAANDGVIVIKDILSFTVQDTGIMRKEYTGKWIGAVRPRLDWHTVQLS